MIPTNILIVDDSATQLELLKYLLEQENYRVTTALNGYEAIAVAHSELPALIISDIVMPVMDGYEMCRRIKSDTQLHDVPIMLLTTLADTEDIISGLNAQADYYLTKPYDGDYLLEKVRGILVEHDGQRDDADPADAAPALEIVLDGKTHCVLAGRRQMLNMMLSTYDHAVQRNRELMRVQDQLKSLNRQMQSQQLELEEANQQLQTLATVDALTGLKNFRAFQERLEEELQRSIRYGYPLSLLLLDVDRFKQFNDTFGHPAGDEVLKSVARLIAQTIRTTDMAARYGGEEFVVILPNTPEADSLICAERIRVALESAPWTQRPITASLGASTLELKVADRAILIAAADAALYRSKKDGRNRVTHNNRNDLQPQWEASA